MTLIPDVHSKYSPSSSQRWIACPPSRKLNEDSPDSESQYTREGTVAHRLAELRLRETWEGKDITEELKEVTASPFYCRAMEEYVADYLDFIASRMAEATARCPDPQLLIETEVHFEDYAPGGFGTSDACIIADDLMDVIDLKYGTGVRVSAENNSQMLLYGLGQYLEQSWMYNICTVRMTIFQPRIGNISSDEISVQDLLDWADSVLKPAVALAEAGEGDFCPGEKQCRWCAVAATCRARAEYQLELAKYDFAAPDTLDWDEIGEILAKIPDFTRWAESVQAYAQDAAIQHGQTIPGWKLVAGRSTRKYTDESAIARKLRRSGYKTAEIFKPRSLLGLTALEKLVGAKKLDELIGKYITKPEGAPVLVPEHDKRPELNTAAAAANDFMEV